MHDCACFGLQGLPIPQNMLQSMMQNPMVQQMFSNPETMRNMLQMNPAVREVRQHISSSWG